MPSITCSKKPNGQFFRLQCICSQQSDYLLNSKIKYTKFTECIFHEKKIKKIIKQVAKMDRNELLGDQTWENKDPKTISISTWNPKLNAVLSILKNKFDLISNDPQFSLQCITLWKMQTLPPNKCSKTHH